LDAIALCSCISVFDHSHEIERDLIWVGAMHGQREERREEEGGDEKYRQRDAQDEQTNLVNITEALKKFTVPEA
jgi:hypothetical protein